ncbi:MAG: EamA family transporter [Nanoarchaeota archaeon]|nr:EamA family transporter [Nanoarchaeota archaeon]
MLWVILAIISAAIWSIVAIIDKYIITKHIKEPIVPVMIIGLIAIIASILIYIFNGYSTLSTINIFLAIITGALFVPQILFYFKALKIGEVSRIIPLFYMSPIIVFILAAIFLGEVFTLGKYLGMILVVIGSIFITMKKMTKFSIGKEFWLIMLSVIFLSIITILTKYLLGFADYWTVFAYIKIGNFIATIPIVYLYYGTLSRALAKSGKKVVGLLLTNETIALTASLIFIIALSLGSASLVTGISAVQPFFVLLYATILSLFLPKILKEEISKSVIIHKLFAIVLVFIGGYLIII